jgi:hypothetical protein
MTLPALDGNQDNYLFIAGSLTPLGTFKQYPTSSSLFTLDYSEYLVASETLSSVAYSVLPVTTPPLVVSASNFVPVKNVANKGVSFLLGGGVDGTNYTVTITATTNLSQIKVDALNEIITSQSSGVGCSVGYPVGCGSGSSGGTTNSHATEGTFAWLSNRINVGVNNIVVAPQRSGRHAVTLVNVGTTYCEVSHAPSFSIGQGTPLSPGGAVTLDTQAAVYGRSLDFNGQLSVMETY